MSTLLADLPHVVWSPQPGSQTLFVSSPIFETLYDGTRGPGKTNALLMDFCQHVGTGLGSAWRGILFRQSYPALADIVAKSEEWIPQAFPRATFNRSAYTWHFPDGEELLLRYIDSPKDYWSYHGHEYPWIGWDELTNWPDAKCYDVMRSCCRSSKPQVPRKYRATANPHGPGHHWVKARFVDGAPPGVPQRDKHGNLRVRIHGHWSENQYLLRNDPEYAQRLLESTEDDPDRQAAWLDGSWDIVAGTFFGGAWSPKYHVLSGERALRDLPLSWRIDRSFDWGSSHPFSVGWWAESDGTPVRQANGEFRTFPRGSVIRIGEWYGCVPGKPNTGLRLVGAEIAAGILARERARWPGRQVMPGPADSSIFDVQDGHRIVDSFLEAGVSWEKANKGPGSRKNGADRIRELLGNAKRAPLEKPGLYITEDCRDFIRTVPSLPRSEKFPDDVDTDAEDHIYDETRYRLLAPPPAMVTFLSYG